MILLRQIAIRQLSLIVLILRPHPETARNWTLRVQDCVTLQKRPSVRAFFVPTAADSISPQFSGFTPMLEWDLLGGSATLSAGNPLIVDVVPEYQKMRHNSS
jgi:hypothetical protein